MNKSKAYKEANLDIKKFMEYLVNEGILKDQDKIRAIIFPDENRKIKIFYNTERVKVPQIITKGTDPIIAEKSNEEKREFLNLEIYELELSNRVKDCLKDNFSTARQLVESNEVHLRKMRGVGSGSIDEIKIMLAENGFRLNKQ